LTAIVSLLLKELLPHQGVVRLPAQDTFAGWAVVLKGTAIFAEIVVLPEVTEDTLEIGDELW
jgi:hypothetical protein